VADLDADQQEQLRQGSDSIVARLQGLDVPATASGRTRTHDHHDHNAAQEKHKRNWWQFAGYIARRATMLELHGYQSIYRFVFRRPKVLAASVGFG
jgi:hypothetical protein